MKKIKYMTSDNPTPLKDKVLNIYGENGWNLVSMTPIKNAFGLVYHYIFKKGQD